MASTIAQTIKVAIRLVLHKDKYKICTAKMFLQATTGGLGMEAAQF
jgi:hypothetical protein